MSKFMNGLYNLVNTWQPLVWILVAIALFTIGVMFVIPSQKSKDLARGLLPWVVIGCGVAAGATILAKEISSAFVF
jgi:hypothetical protein